MITNNFDVIVIHKMQYQEANAILTVVSETGIHKVLARGIFKQASRNKLACEIGSFANFTVLEGKSFLQLKTATLFKSSLTKEYRSLLISQLICELCYRMQYHNYQVIKKALIIANYHGLLYFLYHLTKENGIFFEVNHCIRSNASNHFIGISLEDGGLVNKDYFQKNDIRLSKEEIILFKVLPRVNDDTFDKYLNLELSFKLCKIYLRFLSIHFDIYSKIQQFLEEGEKYE